MRLVALRPEKHRQRQRPVQKTTQARRQKLVLGGKDLSLPKKNNRSFGKISDSASSLGVRHTPMARASCTWPTNSKEILNLKSSLLNVNAPPIRTSNPMKPPCITSVFVLQKRVDTIGAPVHTTKFH